MDTIRLRPSEAETWLTCTEQPWFLLENQHRIPKDDTVWSVEGTRAHEVAEALLTTGEADFDSDIQAVHLFNYYELVMGLMQEGETLLVEPPTPLWYMPERHGKIDSAIVGWSRLEIVDLKYGEGVAVYARGNPQLGIYGRACGEELMALGLIDLRPESRVRLNIFQPRCSHGETLTTWDLSWGELVEVTDGYAAIAEDIKARRNTKLDASNRKGCRFCDCQEICPAYNERQFGGESMDMIDVFGPSPDPVPAPRWPEPKALSPDAISRILEHGDDIIGYVGKVREYAKSMLSGGRPDQIPGWKLVEGQAGKRSWVDEKAAETLLTGKGLTIQQRRKSHLISPAQAEKLIPAKERNNPQFKARWDSLVHRPPPSGKVLVPIGDARETITVQGELEFENLDFTPAKGEEIL